jgi:TatD DNase family protein
VAGEPLDPSRLAEALHASAAVAVGEVGLDFVIPSPDRARQAEVLEQQIEVALSLDLPLILHCRGAFEELLAILRRHAPRLRGVLHAFSRGPELAQRFLDLGLHLAFGGAITRPRAKRAQRAATAAPAERLLLETDAPSIGLEGVEPEAVEPHHVATISDCLARLRGEPPERIARSTTDNARALFRLP